MHAVAQIQPLVTFIKCEVNFCKISEFLHGIFIVPVCWIWSHMDRQAGSHEVAIQNGHWLSLIHPNA